MKDFENRICFSKLQDENRANWNVQYSYCKKDHKCHIVIVRQSVPYRFQLYADKVVKNVSKVGMNVRSSNRDGYLCIRVPSNIEETAERRKAKGNALCTLVMVSTMRTLLRSHTKVNSSNFIKSREFLTVG